MIWFVSRHQGAVEWINRKFVLNEEVRLVESLDAGEVKKGDIVVGTLPVHLIAEVGAKGARYFHITMDIPPEARGKELTPDDMDRFGAKLQEFSAFQSGLTIAQKIAERSDSGAHVCLVTDQLFANLLPILKYRPKYIELICTPDMKSKGALNKLRRAIKRFNFASEISVREIDDRCATDLSIARTHAKEIYAVLSAKYKQRLTLNITGGTKILSIAFFLEFSASEMIYADTPKGMFRFLDKPQRSAEPMGSLITRIDDYLYCQGFKKIGASSDRPKWRENAKKRRAFTEFLASSKQVIRYFNTIAGGKIFPNTLPKWFDRDMLDKMTALDLIVQNNGVLSFADNESRKYLRGGWLEELTYVLALDVGFDECACGLLTAFNGSEVKTYDNEFDLVVLHRNQLFVAECKATKEAKLESQDIYNRLDALGNMAKGVFGEKALVTSSMLPPESNARQRAKNYGIKIIEGDDLAVNLRAMFKSWKEGR